MREIRMVDLQRQYMRLKQEIDSSMAAVLESTTFIKGEEVRLFEEELARSLNVKHVISCGNGTDALQIALMALNLKPGDEVITTNFTFIATAEVIALLGLKPVFVEPDPITFNISVEETKKAITDRTRAIIPVHLFGQCADMDGLLALTRDIDIKIIEDNAQALGALYTSSKGNSGFAGTLGDIGTTSFFPSKNLGCFGDGGAIFTNDDSLASLLRSIANHGMTRRYYHDHIGINSRLDTIQAAVLRVKLKQLDLFNRSRQELALQYDKGFRFIKGITTPERSKFSTHIFHQYTLKLDSDDRDNLKEYLALNDVPSMVYYPVPLHQQEAYRYLGYNKSQFPITNSLAGSVLSLPMHTEMDNDQTAYIIEKVQEFFEEI
jgi:dTDP-4-amino-4,6-dideoxygalactose transaminase